VDVVVAIVVVVVVVVVSDPGTKQLLSKRETSLQAIPEASWSMGTS